MEKALKEYYNHFGENYPLIIVENMTDDEIVQRINHCIETNQKEKEPDFEDDNDY